jgi:hypothetical protein
VVFLGPVRADHSAKGQPASHRVILMGNRSRFCVGYEWDQPKELHTWRSSFYIKVFSKKRFFVKVR